MVQKKKKFYVEPKNDRTKKCSYMTGFNFESKCYFQPKYLKNKKKLQSIHFDFFKTRQFLSSSVLIKIYRQVIQPKNQMVY